MSCGTVVCRAALLCPIRHYLFDFTSQLSKMDGEALVKLALLHSRRASGDLLRIVGFCAQLLCAEHAIWGGTGDGRPGACRSEPSCVGPL